MPHVLPTHKKGDTFPGETFHMYDLVDEVQVPIDLTGVLIRMDCRAAPTSPLAFRFTNFPTGDLDFPGGGISITDPLTGTWELEKQVIDYNKPIALVYDVEFTFPTDPPEIMTLIEGTWSITQDVTHD